MGPLVRKGVLPDPEGGLRAVPRADALEDAGEVVLHGLLADAEAARDLLVREAAGEEAEDVAFARAEVEVAALLRPVGEDGPRDLRCEGGLTACCGEDTPDELVGLRILEEVA